MFVLLFLLFAAPASLPLATTAAAGPMHHHELGMMMWGMTADQQIDKSVNTLQHTLNLTNTQRDSIRQLAQSRRDGFQSIREQLQPKHDRLMTLLKQPNPDPAAVGRATIELKTIHDQAVAKQANLEKQFMDLLNPAQKQTVNDVRRQADTYKALHRLGLLGTAEHGMLRSSLNIEP
jgi:Spy/CpxP family protein refolding chaperone